MAEAVIEGPLAGVRVVDMTSALAGPFCTLLLASMGAEVIKIEAPGGSDLARTNPPYVGRDGLHLGSYGADEISVFLLNRTRNKQSITLDVKSPAGKEMLYELVKVSDVFVQNLSDGAVDRMGADYKTLRALNEGLVYCSIFGVSDDSPFAGLKVMDILVQALSGIMDVTGDPGGPPMRVGIPIGDLCGPLFAVSGILAALRVSERTGVGQKVSVSLVDALASLVAAEHFDALSSVGIAARSGNSHSRLAPFGVYPCRDGFVAIAAVMDEWFAPLARAIGREDLVSDERFTTRAARVDHSAKLDELIVTWTKVRSKDEVVRVLFTVAGVPTAPVRSVGDVLTDESLRRSGAIVPLRHPDPTVQVGVAGSGVPWRFSMSPVGLDRPAPRLGADNEAVYGGLLGLGPGELARLRREGVI
jgi:crotonobetainyl-CoA:carnitine CoA-transferase CaiB-like acyl-CoA transferase